VRSIFRTPIEKSVQHRSIRFGVPAKIRHFRPVPLNRASTCRVPKFISPCSEATASHEYMCRLGGIVVQKDVVLKVGWLIRGH
jgi:hypothetical protein